MLQVTVTLTFDLLTPKSKGINYGTWSSMIPRKVYLSKISLKLMSGHDFVNPGPTDGRTDMRHNKIWPKLKKIETNMHVLWTQNISRFIIYVTEFSLSSTMIMIIIIIIIIIIIKHSVIHLLLLLLSYYRKYIKLYFYSQFQN